VAEHSEAVTQLAAGQATIAMIPEPLVTWCEGTVGSEWGVSL